VLLPSRHEAGVIGETIYRLSQANYPKSKFELLVICTPDDSETIAAAKTSIRQHKIKNAKVIVFDLPSGKSRGMNIGLSKAKFNLVTIFDSEDDVSPEIFNIANTFYLQRKIDVLQCGVQLMDFNSHWFSTYNVLEYFFQYKSRVHFFARMGLVPLGGNTVFFKTEDLKEIGGWDEHGLCEDADVGIRLSLKGKKFGVMYDAEHVTREEVPSSAGAFVKQRTRWNQGFLQILNKSDWRQLPGLKRRILALYALCSPSFMGLVILLSPFLIVIGFLFKVSVLVSLLSFVPFFLSALTLLVSLIGLREFGRDQKLKIRLRHYVYMLITFLPYQALLVVSAFRAYIRHKKGHQGWEKTLHLGTHRKTTVRVEHTVIDAIEGTRLAPEEPA
jgi:cellulose synthase/poly-beta-1,6-N-acetylglucosamine synthase-like glycosyltransferase